jgi:hypothetical protein
MTTSPGPEPSVSAAPVAWPGRPIALLLAAVIPGAGHLYARRWVAGALWMAASFAAYASFLWLGLAVHGLCVVSTAFIRRP